jgi:hypothetical protein
MMDEQHRCSPCRQSGVRTWMLHNNISLEKVGLDWIGWDGMGWDRMQSVCKVSIDPLAVCRRHWHLHSGICTLQRCGAAFLRRGRRPLQLLAVDCCRLQIQFRLACWLLLISFTRKKRAGCAFLLVVNVVTLSFGSRNRNIPLPHARQQSSDRQGTAKQTDRSQNRAPPPCSSPVGFKDREAGRRDGHRRITWHSSAVVWLYI